MKKVLCLFVYTFAAGRGAGNPVGDSEELLVNCLTVVLNVQMEGTLTPLLSPFPALQERISVCP
jgi:hypothetical protein